MEYTLIFSNSLHRRSLFPLFCLYLLLLFKPSLSTPDPVSSKMSPASYLESKFSLSGRCAIISGGGTGIGLAISKGFVLAGAKVVLIGRREKPLIDACATINEAAGGEPKAFYVSADVTNTDGLAEVVANAESLAGMKPTILVNNAGVNVRQKAENLTDKHWELSLNLMLTAPFNLARAMSNNFKAENYGRIINVGSLQSYQAFPDSIPYASAKSGCLGLTRAMAEYYSTIHGFENVTCNAFAPGYVKTELTASVFANKERAKLLGEATLLGRNSVPEDLVGPALFLASAASSYITGQTISVDGGFTALGLR